MSGSEGKKRQDGAAAARRASFDVGSTVTSTEAGPSQNSNDYAEGACRYAPSKEEYLDLEAGAAFSQARILPLGIPDPDFEEFVASLDHTHLDELSRAVTSIVSAVPVAENSLVNAPLLPSSSVDASRVGSEGAPAQAATVFAPSRHPNPSVGNLRLGRNCSNPHRPSPLRQVVFAASCISANGQQGILKDDLGRGSADGAS